MTKEMLLLICYIIGVASNVVIFFIQKTQINKMKTVTDQVEKYFRIVNVDEFEKFIKVKEKRFETQMEIVAHDMSKKFSENYMEKFGNKYMDKHLQKLDKEIGDQMSELGWFTAEWLAEMSERDRLKFIDDFFPKSKQLLLENIEQVKANDILADDIENFLKEHANEIPTWTRAIFFEKFESRFPDEIKKLSKADKEEFFTQIMANQSEDMEKKMIS